MLPYSATDALNSMNAAYGLEAAPLLSPERIRPSRIIRWLRSLAHLA
jgi:hypothetical protein